MKQQMSKDDMLHKVIVPTACAIFNVSLIGGIIFYINYKSNQPIKTLENVESETEIENNEELNLNDIEYTTEEFKYLDNFEIVEETEEETTTATQILENTTKETIAWTQDYDQYGNPYLNPNLDYTDGNNYTYKADGTPVEVPKLKHLSDEVYIINNNNEEYTYSRLSGKWESVSELRKIVADAEERSRLNFEGILTFAGVSKSEMIKLTDEEKAEITKSFAIN